MQSHRLIYFNVILIINSEINSIITQNESGIKWRFFILFSSNVYIVFIISVIEYNQYKWNGTIFKVSQTAELL